jgi:hypothetical protein
LKDNTGKVLVAPFKAEIDVPKSYFFDTGIFSKEPPIKIKNFLKKNNLNYKGFLGFKKQMRFTEWTIVPGDKLYVLGNAIDNPGVAEGTAQMSHHDIMIDKKGGNPFYISNKSEKNILGSLGFKTYAYLIGGPVLSLICLFILLGVFNLI